MRHPTRFHPRREYQTEPSEDSDIIVALFRFGLILAFTGVMYTQPVYLVSVQVAIVVATAALYSLGLMIGYLVSRRATSRRTREVIAAHPVWGPLAKRRLGLQRVVALVIDLALVTAIIHDRHYLSLEFFGLYYIIVAAGALWFHRWGGILAAFAAAICMAWLVLAAGDLVGDPYLVVAPRAVIGIAIGLIVGYLARAREAERRQGERHDWELNVARRVQAQMLPGSFPDVPGYEIGMRFEPARAVGGDYYDVIAAPDGRLFLAIADVAGKSVYAAMHLSLLRSHLLEAIAEGLAPVAVAERLNKVLLAALPTETFISMFVVAIDVESGAVTYVNCGHTPPIITTPGSEEPSRTLFTGQIVLGVMETPEYSADADSLEPGECVVMCTDGVTESMDAEYEPFGMRGVGEAVRGVTGDADAIAGAVLDAAQAFSKRAAPDDATVLVAYRPAGDEAESDSV